MPAFHCPTCGLTAEWKEKSGGSFEVDPRGGFGEYLVRCIEWKNRQISSEPGPVFHCPIIAKEASRLRDLSHLRRR